MPSDASISRVSRIALWCGRILSAAVVLFLLFDGITKLIQESHVVEGMALLGYPAHLIVPIGIEVLACTVLYVIPRTAILGAILLTGHLGGATASMVRVGDPQHPYAFPVVFGILVWLGLYMRDDLLRKLIPIRKES
ncbi:MAG: DoxX family protein [SAR324 cluster bacterium]